MHAAAAGLPRATVLGVCCTPAAKPCAPGCAVYKVRPEQMPRSPPAPHAAPSLQPGHVHAALRQPVRHRPEQPARQCNCADQHVRRHVAVQCQASGAACRVLKQGGAAAMLLVSALPASCMSAGFWSPKFTAALGYKQPSACHPCVPFLHVFHSTPPPCSAGDLLLLNPDGAAAKPGDSLRLPCYPPGGQGQAPKVRPRRRAGAHPSAWQSDAA